MKISKKDIQSLVSAQIEKQTKKLQLEQRKAEIEKELQNLSEDYSNPQMAPVDNRTEVGANVAEEEKESMFDAKLGEMIILSFQGVTIKVQRQYDDLFKVVDATESAKLKEGDYIKVQGDDILSPGKQYTFSVIRQIEPKYKTNALSDWRIIKN